MLDVFADTLPRLLCPGLASEAFAGDCPAAEEVLAAENPLAEAPPGVVALVYLVQFGEDTSFPVLDGPRPPDAVLEAAARAWDDMPLSVYLQPAT
jgi:hypothetical protein